VTRFLDKAENIELNIYNYGLKNQEVTLALFYLLIRPENDCDVRVNPLATMLL
jgi:hypothetical protein